MYASGYTAQKQRVPMHNHRNLREHRLYLSLQQNSLFTIAIGVQRAMCFSSSIKVLWCYFVFVVVHLSYHCCPHDLPLALCLAPSAVPSSSINAPTLLGDRRNVQKSKKDTERKIGRMGGSGTEERWGIKKHACVHVCVSACLWH